ncbi:phospho-N-acetylmuramoyl-pentapeptide-transferase-like protein isoform X1 [Senna tora]|uniref:Phospho-N-acetylmuramoyl-pentapeptide-transferase-like protein isoform X1 n=1 Tax=Senna tora TaxID=362788 RepID=A0A834XBB7_9FABA|nr:phospho-N-acetylmuramoyl-pentapeptide-transferase-like protein isoform X1 [Senna tora]
MYSYSHSLSHHHLLYASRNQFSLDVAARGRSTSLNRYRCSKFCFRQVCLCADLHWQLASKGTEVRRQDASMPFAGFALGKDSFDLPMLDDWSADENSSGYLLSSSDDDSDGEIVINTVNDVDLPASDYVLVLALHVFPGLRISYPLASYWCAWRIVRLPLAPFYLTRPFLISAILVSVVGYVFVPFFRIFKFIQVVKKEGPVTHLLKKKVPTLGGLLFVPIGVIVARAIGNSSSIILSGAADATLAFAAIGLLDDILSLIKNQQRGLPAWAKVLLEVAVGTWFSIWLDITRIPSPYGICRITLVPLPLGLMYLGRYYQLLTSFCFVSMGHGVEITNGLDGLASGTAALAFIGMAIAVLPICSDLSIFGASMAGSCVGFLLHNRYKASVYMGDIGSLALAGALAAMAACTGMFFPLLISSGIFVVEASSVMIQVLYFSMTRGLQRARRHFFRMAPIHHHLQLSGFKEPNIVAGAYLISSVLALLAGYVGLVSA